MTLFYEFRVAGHLGPVTRSALSELTATNRGSGTILTGHAERSDDLDLLLRRLDEHGLVAMDVRISRRDRH